MLRDPVLAALAKELITSLDAAARQRSPHVETPGLCKALAVAVTASGVAMDTDRLAESITRAAEKTLADLRSGVADEHGVSTRELLAQHADDTLAHGLFDA